MISTTRTAEETRNVQLVQRAFYEWCHNVTTAPAYVPAHPDEDAPVARIAMVNLA